MDAGVELNAEAWVEDNDYPGRYSMPLPSNAKFSNICIMDNKALYPYPTLNANILTGGYNLNELSFEHDGFVRDGSKIWIKTVEGINPAKRSVIVSKGFRFLTVYGNNYDTHLKIQGIIFKHFGKPSDDNYASIVFDIRKANHVTFDNCHFSFNTSPIVFNGDCTHLSKTAPLSTIPVNGGMSC